MHSVLFFLLFLIVSAPVVHLFKVTRVSYDLGAYFFYIGSPSAFFCVWFGVLLSVWRRRLPWGFFVFFFLALYGSLLFFFYGGSEVDFFGNLLRFLFCAGMICFFYLNGCAVVDFLDYNSLFISRLSLVVSSLSAISLHAVSFAGGAVYFGLQNTLVLIPLSYGLVYSRFSFVMISLLVVGLSGKRGGMLAAFCVVLYYIFVKVFFYRSKVALRFMVLFFMVAFALLAFGYVPQSISKRFEQFQGGSEVDWNAATAGRVDEISAALSVIKEDYFVGLWGMGHGAAVDINGAIDSTVHFTPLGLTMIVGVGGAIIVYSYFLSFIVRSIKFFSGRHKVFELWFLVFLGEFVFSFTAFTLLQSYLLWLSFGVVIFYFSEKRGVSRLAES